MGVKEFREINWLPTKESFEQCVCTNNVLQKHISHIHIRIIQTFQSWPQHAKVKLQTIITIQKYQLSLVSIKRITTTTTTNFESKQSD